MRAARHLTNLFVYLSIVTLFPTHLHQTKTITYSSESEKVLVISLTAPYMFQVKTSGRPSSS